MTPSLKTQLQSVRSGEKVRRKYLRRPFLPAWIDCPWFSEDAKTWEPKKTNPYCSMIRGVINPKIYWYLIKLLKLQYLSIYFYNE